MKIKDLPKDVNLSGLKVKTTDGRIGYWRSQWDKGVWLTKEVEDTRIFPIFVDSLNECLDWEVEVKEKSNLK